MIRRLSPAPVCDDCIADRLRLTALDQTRLRTRELAGQGDHERATAACALCGAVKSTIRKLPR